MDWGLRDDMSICVDLGKVSELNCGEGVVSVGEGSPSGLRGCLHV